MLLSTEFLETQIDDEELKNSILSIKRQIFLIQNLVNEFSNFARLPKAIIKKSIFLKFYQFILMNIKEIIPKLSFNQVYSKRSLY